MATENQDLRNAGLKVTLPRVKILQILEGSEDKHFSAEDVYKALIEADEDVGLATVYRVLTQFETAGLVMRRAYLTMDVDFSENWFGRARIEIADGVAIETLSGGAALRALYHMGEVARTTKTARPATILPVSYIVLLPLLRLRRHAAGRRPGALRGAGAGRLAGDKLRGP